MTAEIICLEHGVVDAEVIEDGELHEFTSHVHVILKNGSSAVLRENSRAELWGNSSAELRENSRAELWGNSRAELWGNSRAELWENSRAELRSLFSAAVLRDKNSKATGGKPKQRIALLSQTTEPREWLKLVGAQMDGKKTILYKRTSHEFETRNGIRYLLGTLVEAPDWDPDPECGGGLHFCIDPTGCDAFRDGKKDRYVACLVDPKDIVIHACPEYPDKIKAKKCTVLYECDREGKKIEMEAEKREAELKGKEPSDGE